MNLALHQKASIRWSRGILYCLTLVVVLASLPLGMMIAAMGAWFAIEGGSLMYLPLGLTILLAGLAILDSHSIPDFVLLALVGLAMIGWSISGSDTKGRVMSMALELPDRIDLLLGLLVTMVVALAIVYWRRAHWQRSFADPAEAFVR